MCLFLHSKSRASDLSINQPVQFQPYEQQHINAKTGILWNLEPRTGRFDCGVLRQVNHQENARHRKTIACNLGTQSPKRSSITHESNASASAGGKEMGERGREREMQGYLLGRTLDAPAEFLVEAVGGLGLLLVRRRLWVAERFLERLTASHHLVKRVSFRSQGIK